MTLTRSLLAGCALALMTAGAALAQDAVKFGYINKMGDHPWFVSEVAGAKAKAEELGAQLMVQDVQFDANLTITTFDTMVGDGVKGIAIVVPDKALGPVVAQKAKDAGIALIAVDDDITYQDGSPVPYVGIDALTIGKQVGAELARLAKEAGWDQDWSKVRIGSVEDQKADTCMRRNQGAKEAIQAAFPGLPADAILSIPYDNTMVNAIDVVGTTLTANPGVERWIFFSCNDDGVLGSVRATENAGMSPDQVMGVGIDGSRSCEAFGAGKPTGFRGTMWFDSATHGATAIAALHDNVTKGTPLPMVTYMPAILINAGNFGDYKAKLGCS
ncbi:MAG: substrate-binding domain-containing protein [Geminicoccaceae bacterium]